MRVIISSIGILYLAAPALALCSRQIRAVVLQPIHEVWWQGHPTTKLATFVALVLVSAVFAWPLFIRGWLSREEQEYAMAQTRKRAHLDELAQRECKPSTQRMY